MIEVFKTNVNDYREASKLQKRITNLFPSCNVNFDLEDCDKVLRVCNHHGTIEAERIIKIISELGYEVEVLE